MGPNVPANPYRSVRPFEDTSLEDSVKAIDDVLISDVTGDLKPLTIAFDWSTMPQGSKRWADIFDGHTCLTPDDRAFLEFLRHDFNERIKEASPEPESTKIVSDADIVATGLPDRAGGIGAARLFLSRSLLKVALGYGIGGAARRRLVELKLLDAGPWGREDELSVRGREWLWALYGGE